MKSAMSSAWMLTASSERPTSSSTKSKCARAKRISVSIWLRLDLAGKRRVVGRGNHAEVRQDADHRRLQQRFVEPADVARDVRERRRRAPVGDEQRRIAELQVQVDQQHALAFVRGQRIAEVGGQEGRAASALARDEGRDLAVRLGGGLLPLAQPPDRLQQFVTLHRRARRSRARQGAAPASAAWANPARRSGSCSAGVQRCEAFERLKLRLGVTRAVEDSRSMSPFAGSTACPSSVPSNVCTDIDRVGAGQRRRISGESVAGPGRRSARSTAPIPA